MNFIPFQHLYTHIKRHDIRLYEALDRISINIQNLFESLTDSDITVTSSGSVTFVSLTLTANTNIASPIVPPLGGILIVKILQDSTGGWVTTWDSSFKTVPNLGSLDPDAYSTITFVGEGGKWWIVSMVTDVVQ